MTYITTQHTSRAHRLLGGARRGPAAVPRAAHPRAPPALHTVAQLLRAESSEANGTSHDDAQS
eukprot:CAMPEP_0182544812 /NCGR_PEP_ID=MMETSP1323-20130603/33685_1 /TAXON_ID=236787 /ORGANISM="Florenciella parvula, Strain RCC1693" /LENGTH=62 /DNA_ID=CAMNT_0024755897 /DNA_START=49 /DNA_END=237 /DNA_ORIENTATION=+